MLLFVVSDADICFGNTLSLCVSSPKETRGNHPERFEFSTGAIPDDAFTPGCDRLDKMTHELANDIEQYGAGDQLVSERVYCPWESE